MDFANKHMMNGQFFFRALPYGIFFLLLSVILIGMGNALTPLLFSAGLAYLVFPLIQRLEKLNIKRNIAVAFVFSVILLFFIFSLFFLLPYLFEETQIFIEQLPHYINSAILLFSELSVKLGFQITLDKPTILNWLHLALPKLSLSSASSVVVFIKKIIGNLLGMIMLLLNLFLFPLFFFYVVNDYENIRQEVIHLIPKKILPSIQIFLAKCDQILSGYIRGQLMVAFILAILYSLSFMLIKLQFGFLIGLGTGFLSIIPYVGFAIGLLTAILVWAATNLTTALLIKIIAVFVVIQLVEGLYITPKLVGNKVGLSHLVTIIALIVGGNLAGFLGILLAIPVAAILKFLYESFKKRYIQSAS